MTSPPGPDDQHPIWFDTSPGTAYEALAGDRRVDTAVVGGGIVGISVADELAEAGQSVLLLERDRLLRGVTGHTTAKVTAQHGRIYDYLIEEFGTDRARQYAQANQQAIEDIAARIEDRSIDCDFERCPSYLYTRDVDQREQYEREANVADSLGLPATYVESLPGPVSGVAGVRFDEQGLFHPRQYLLALAERVVEAGGTIVEETTVTDIEPGQPCTVETDRGRVDADDVVLATHFPIHDRAFYFARVYPKQSHVLALELAEPAPEGMYYRPGNPYLSVRPRPAGDETSVLVGGQDHRTGHGGDTRERFERLERQARAHLDVERVTHRWTTQDHVSIDRVPFVGKHSPLSEHVYVATGFGGWGLTNGTAAGTLIADLVLDRPNPARRVFHPTRRPVTASLRSLLGHGAHVARHTVDDHLGSAASPAAVDLKRGEGEVLEADGDPVAVSRDESGGYHAVSAVCTHQGCHVHWNEGERTWDCPCHGSRFDIDGNVIDTPAVEHLPTRDLPDGTDQ